MHLARIRKSRLKIRYNLTQADIDRLLIEQDNNCACCGKPFSEVRAVRGKGKYNVDHDHITGKVRGLLCIKCNSGIGLLGDTVETVSKAVLYLQRSRADKGQLSPVPYC